MTDPNSAKKSADNPQAASPSAPAEVILDPSDPHYFEQRQRMAADEARAGQEAAAKLRESNLLGSVVMTAQGTVTNPGEAESVATNTQGTIPSGVSSVTATESSNSNTRTAPESGTRRTTSR